MLGKIEGRRRRRWQRVSCLDGILESMDMNLSNSGDCGGQESLVCAVHGVTRSQI